MIIFEKKLMCRKISCAAYLLLMPYKNCLRYDKRNSSTQLYRCHVEPKLFCIIIIVISM